MANTSRHGGEYQFHKCGGTLDPSVAYPYNPIITPGLKEPHILDSPLDIVHSIMSILHKVIPNYAECIDNPILIIKEVEKQQLPGKKCAQLFKALYIISSRNSFRQRNMYAKYYIGMSNLVGYNTDDKLRITKARFSNENISEIYKDAFYKYSRYL